MVKKTRFSCQQCAAIHSKWAGQCNECGAWNSIVEETSPIPHTQSSQRFAGYAGAANSQLMAIAEVAVEEKSRIALDDGELDRVLGGGVVPGSIVLIGGDPGIGKSTLLLQAMEAVNEQYAALYVSGEESLQQIKLRAQRLHLSLPNLKLLAETNIETILTTAADEKPQVMVIDSIQTVFSDLIQTAPGAVGQVRECAAQLVRFAKQTNTALFLVGHVTKDGVLAGPRVLEHMVDTVLYFEGQQDSRFRVVRAIKNRFGAVNELGVFAMTEQGLKSVKNPSAIFLSGYDRQVAGSVVMATWEGSRPLLVEVQALVDESHIANPRRVTVGLEQNRLAMLLAVLHKHGNILTYNQDVFVNIVGGVKVSETAADLPLIIAILSSLRNQPIPPETVIFGEIGLAGEIRPVQNGQDRLKEAAKHGFKRAIIPKANLPREQIVALDICPADKLSDALDKIHIC